MSSDPVITDAPRRVEVTGISADTQDAHTLRLHFRAPVTDADRSDLLAAINAVRALPSPSPSERREEIARALWESDETLYLESGRLPWEKATPGDRAAAYRRADAILSLGLPAPAPTPLDMVLHCPACGLQHIDKPESVNWRDASRDASGTVGARWTNPPHRSHLCAGCGFIWRPADVPTNGVAATQTHGKADSPPAPAPAPVSPDYREGGDVNTVDQAHSQPLGPEFTGTGAKDRTGE